MFKGVNSAFFIRKITNFVGHRRLGTEFPLANKFR